MRHVHPCAVPECPQQYLCYADECPVTDWECPVCTWHTRDRYFTHIDTTQPKQEPHHHEHQQRLPE
jgi:hypothetical protein